jgi:hypothetical protein
MIGSRNSLRWPCVLTACFPVACDVDAGGTGAPHEDGGAGGPSDRLGIGVAVAKARPVAPGRCRVPGRAGEWCRSGDHADRRGWRCANAERRRRRSPRRRCRRKAASVCGCRPAAMRPRARMRGRCVMDSQCPASSRFCAGPSASSARPTATAARAPLRACWPASHTCHPACTRQPAVPGRQRNDLQHEHGCMRRLQHVGRLSHVAEIL